MNDIKTYQITKEQCQAQIDKINGVCNRCGRKPVPIETVDNSNNPTFWSGCMHGNMEECAWGEFTSGVSKKIFDIAEKLVCEGEIYYSWEDTSDAAYWFQTQVSGFCGLLARAERLKTQSPRRTKEEFLKAF